MKKISQRRTVFKVTSLLSGLLLIRFSLSKLFAWPISVKAFIEMAKPLNIDPTFFRLSVGVLITTICLGYFYNFISYIRAKGTKGLSFIKVNIFLNLLGIGTMSGALLAEFFLREVPKWPLVIIALFILISSIFDVNSLLKTLKKNSEA